MDKSSETEYIINRSRFIGRCFPVTSEEAALSLLGDIRKKHWDATHNCFAYRIGETASIARFSDDGEPGGTAGMPIMDVLRSKELTDVLVVVTRYFGGVLLGAGGLVRAYSRSAADAVTEAGIVSYVPAKQLSVSMDYSRYGSMEQYIRSAVQVEDVEFMENVTMKVVAAEERLSAFIKDITERSDGRCIPQITGESYLRIKEI
ncbi:MAG: YigZ family protein [Clostridia bacterium]|nr:YigZ family protein [Clostridia bacterium]